MGKKSERIASFQIKNKSPIHYQYADKAPIKSQQKQVHAHRDKSKFALAPYHPRERQE